MRLNFFIPLILLLLCPYLALGEAAKFELLIGKIENLKIEAALKVEIEPGWHIYYKNPGDFGLPTSFNLDNTIDILDIHWPKPKQHIDEVGEGKFISWTYENLVVFPITINLPQNSEDAKFTLMIEYAICKEICIPKKEKIEIKTELNHFLNEEVSNLINEWRNK